LCDQPDRLVSILLEFEFAARARARGFFVNDREIFRAAKAPS